MLVELKSAGTKTNLTFALLSAYVHPGMLLFYTKPISDAYIKQINSIIPEVD